MARTITSWWWRFLAALLAAVTLTVFAATRAQADLLVSSFTSNNVLRYNETTGAFIDTFASGGGLSGPTYLIFTPSVVTAVPEPGTMTLAIMGGVAVPVLLRLRRKTCV